MILVFGGTTEANNVIEALLNTGRSVTVSCATQIGGKNIKTRTTDKKLKVITGQLDDKDVEHLLKKNQYKAVIDATHPFAVSISQNTKKACQSTRVPYFRLERQNTQVISNGLIVKVNSFVSAAEEATKLGKRIFLAIGANNVEIFTKVANDKKVKFIVRVLKEEDSVKNCKKAGIEQKNIIPENGPFSTAQNIEHFLKCEADVVVSKDSGIAGGLIEKVNACSQLKLPLILVERPGQDSEAFFEIDELINQVNQFE